METMEWSVEQAMDALKMPETQRQKYMDKIKTSKNNTKQVYSKEKPK